ncbi:hypothetical protein NBM05_08925 [Rothia sp. AR01]|uniref:Uncharacterized protein n=1 Tax=Rothia santali TaxID=2949643 RepID=A0A9X2HF49_9MICC|nr:hypothetical protein [Rothia santali]MCP3426124.1 hypothetical protein [Rothia santali]
MDALSDLLNSDRAPEALRRERAGRPDLPAENNQDPVLATPGLAFWLGAAFGAATQNGAFGEPKG